jgi:hypothetical protein
VMHRRTCDWKIIVLGVSSIFLPMWGGGSTWFLACVYLFSTSDPRGFVIGS